MFKLGKLARSIPAPLLVLPGVALVAAIGSYIFESPFFLIFSLGAAAVFFNGLLATLEDDLSGGLNNPDGSETPRYVRYVRIGGWSIVGLLVALIALIFSARLS